MKRHSFLAALAAATVFALVAGGVALAHTTSSPTDLTASRSPDGKVAPGTEIDISGRLTSPKAKCQRNSEVRLIQVGEGTIDTTMTGRRGGYSFEVSVQETTRFRVRFPGKVLSAVHPHSHTCEASTARVRVRVA